MKILAALAVILSGCTTYAGSGHVLNVTWKEATDPAHLQYLCAAQRVNDRVGCFRRVGDTCFVYTFKRESYKTLTEFHRTLGHEMHHCFHGYWHGHEASGK